MNGLSYDIIAELAANDFDFFDDSKGSVKAYCGYNRTRHINMVAQLTKQRFAHETVYEWQEVEDFIHGLNHVFFNGVMAGEILTERHK